MKNALRAMAGVVVGAAFAGLATIALARAFCAFAGADMNAGLVVAVASSFAIVGAVAGGMSQTEGW